MLIQLTFSVPDEDVNAWEQLHTGLSTSTEPKHTSNRLGRIQQLEAAYGSYVLRSVSLLRKYPDSPYPTNPRQPLRSFLMLDGSGESEATPRIKTI